MKCDYCNGRGSYDPFSGPTTECPKCKGTGQVGSADATTVTSPENMEFDRALTPEEHAQLDAYSRQKWGLPNPDGTYGKPVLDGMYPEERKAAAQQARVKNSQRGADAAIDKLYNKFVRVTFHPGLNLAPIDGDIIEVETFGPHIQRIKVSDHGTERDIGMHDVSIICETDGTQLWPAIGYNHTPTKGPGFATGGVVKPGDKRYTTANAPAGTPVYYDTKTGMWTTDKAQGDGGCAHIFGAKLTLGSDPWVDHNDEVDDYMEPEVARQAAKDFMDNEAARLGITRQELRTMCLAFAYGRPHGLGPKSRKL